jgi:hypothetical protein
MKARYYGLLVLAVFTLCLASIWIHESPVTAKVEHDAYFADAIHATKLRAREDDNWIFTVHNVNCVENDEGEASFFFKFYLDGELWWDESESTSYRTWLCKRGDNVTLSYKINRWNVIQPVLRNAEIELYWFNGGNPQLEEAISFDFSVTTLVSLQHIHATSYLLAYLMVCFIILSYYYVTRLTLKED